MRSRQAGMTLIEILIALVVLSVGLLGLANLQAVSLRANHAAYLRSQAVFLAYDAVDRMRANRPPALAGEYDIALADSAPASPSTVPEQDLKQWRDFLATTLPSGKGSIDVADGVATVIVQWDDARDQEDAVQLSIETEI